MSRTGTAGFNCGFELKTAFPGVSSRSNIFQLVCRSRWILLCCPVLTYMNDNYPRKAATMETEKNLKSAKGNYRGGKPVEARNDQSRHSFRKVAALQLVCAATIVAGLWIVPSLIGIDLIKQPVETLKIVVALGLPVSLIAFSLVPLRPKNSSVPGWWAIVRGLLSLPVGVLIAAFIAIVFGAPLHSEYASKTFHWAALMTVLVVVPGATVLGASRPTWRRIFACTAPVGPVEIAICIPAHGAAIGAWVGAWPMPLDWERPWQEWPVCCTYGAVGGYLVSLLGSLMWTYHNFRHDHKKQD